MTNVDSNTYYMKGQILFCNKNKNKNKNKTLWFYETDNINMIEFLNDKIFILFAWRVLQQTAGIHMGVICHPILADLFLSSYATYFIQRFLKKNQNELARSFNFTFRYIDDVLSPNNYRFGFDLIFDFLVFNATFGNISAISWRPALVIAEAWVLGENHRPWASNW
jgi:hypothetical protein